jgi:hypothetical protein
MTLKVMAKVNAKTPAKMLREAKCGMNKEQNSVFILEERLC